MATIRTYQFWAHYPDTDGFELIDSWDDNTVAMNYEGYGQALERAQEYAESNGGIFKEIAVDVPADKVYEAFAPTVVTVEE